MQNIINTTQNLERIAQQFANIAAGHPEYNTHGNAWEIPAHGWGIQF